MSLFMESTKISPEQTVTEIQRCLGRYGARSILVEYEDGEVDAVSFQVAVKGTLVPFHLPCRWKAVYSALYEGKKGRNTEKGYAIRDAQAKRVAWRQILRWVEAQMALVQTKMVSMEEVFLPYMQVKPGQTLYQVLENRGFKMLEAPKE